MRPIATCLLAAAAIIGGLTQAARAEEISIAQYNTSLNGMVFAVAIDKGYFKDAGLDIQIQATGSGSANVRSLIAGGMPYAETALPPVISGNKAGAHLLMVNTAQQNIATLGWMVKADSPIKTLGDLKGKSISMTAAQSLTQMADMMMLDAKGYAKGDVRLISAGGFGPTLTLLDTGNLDVAAAGVQAYFAVPPGKYRLLAWASDVLPPVVSTLGITSEKAAHDRPEVIRAIIAARRRAVDFTYAHPKEAADIMAKSAKWGVDATEQVVDAMVKQNLWSRGEFDPAAYDNAIKGLVLVGQLKEPTDWRSIVDEQFLPADLPRMKH